MNPSDFIGLLGLALAAFAIIPWTERKFYMLFFTKIYLGLSVAIIFFIQGLMSFEWLQQHWWPWLRGITCKSCIPANTWAYILAATVVILPVAIIIRGRFPGSNKDKLISLYKKMVAGNEIPQLVQYLETHHKKDIIHFLQQQTTELPNNLEIAKTVYEDIIIDEKFIEYNAKSLPHFLSQIIVSLKTDDLNNKKLVKKYSKHLAEWGNADFLRELDKLPNADWTNINTIFSNNKFPIFKSLILPANPVFRKEAAITIGKSGVASLQQTHTRQFLQTPMEENFNDAEYWGQSIWTVIVFYRLLIQAAIINNDIDELRYVSYYHKYTQILMAIEPVTPSGYSFSLIDIIINNIISWLPLFDDGRIKKQLERLRDILDCLGNIIEEVAACNPDNNITVADFQKKQIKKIIQYYLSLFKADNRPLCEKMEAEIREMLKNPSFIGFQKLPTEKYIDLLFTVWDEWKQEETITPEIQEYVEEKILSPLNVHL